MSEPETPAALRAYLSLTAPVLGMLTHAKEEFRRGVEHLAGEHWSFAGDSIRPTASSFAAADAQLSLVTAPPAAAPAHTLARRVAIAFQTAADLFIARQHERSDDAATAIMDAALQAFRLSEDLAGELHRLQRIVERAEDERPSPVIDRADDAPGIIQFRQRKDGRADM